MIDVALDPGRALDRGGHVRLPRHPGDQATGQCLVAGRHRAAIGPQAGTECGRLPLDRAQALGHQRLARLQQPVLGAVALPRQHFLFQRVEPAVDDRAHGATLAAFGHQVLDQPPVHRFQAMQRRFRFGDLHFRAGEAFRARQALEPAGKERLARPVVAAHSLEPAPARGSLLQLRQQGVAVGVQPDRKRVQRRLGHGAASQRIQDFIGTGG